MNQEELIKKIKDKIDELKLILALDGGGVEYIDYQDGILFGKMNSHCMECMGQ